MTIPNATCRIQFSSHFTFTQLRRHLPYLHSLGVRTIYASPVFRSVEGSAHGYDGLDPHSIDEEIGTVEQLKEIALWLKDQGMNWLQDIVPNHMAYSPQNKWIFELFEWGRDSVYASWFDVNWDHHDPDLKGKLMFPVLGNRADKLIRSGEIELDFREGGFYFSYYEQSFPLAAAAYPELFSLGAERLPDSFYELIEAMGLAVREKDISGWGLIKEKLAAFCENDLQAERYIRSVLRLFNQDTLRKEALLNQQYYRLCPWQEVSVRINYRRFFTISDLICLKMEDPDVFREYHSMLRQLREEGFFQGFRVDHADGLLDPHGYLTRLRQLAGDGAYLITEKILGANESLPGAWPVEGTSGYDFLSLVNNLLTNEHNEKEFERIYRAFGVNDADFEEMAYQKKKFILFRRMYGELDNLTQLFFDLSLDFGQVNRGQAEAVIAELLVLCPVYKIYPESFPLRGRNREVLKAIFEQARGRIPEQERTIRFFEKLFDLSFSGAREKIQQVAFFFRRCMQFTGPVMAKGVEDTSFYTYARFIAHNEVGDSPRQFGISVAAFHEQIGERFRLYPHTMNATATHDTKRGEDARARLLALSDIPGQWEQAVLSWKKMNTKKKSLISGQPVPFAKDEYFLYQSLLGAFPLDPDEEADFTERFLSFAVKALREGKENSSWVSPNEQYEEATTSFIKKIIRRETDFYESFRHFLTNIAGFGMINSLSQLILKHTCPGVPDTYQGCELWDFSMVDPDNRRPVDYEKRERWLAGLKAGNAGREELFGSLLQDWQTGKIKLALTWWLLDERNLHPDIFRDGDYMPLEVTGRYCDHIVAFVREHEQGTYLVALPLQLASLVPNFRYLSGFDWHDTAVNLPSSGICDWENVFSGKKISSAGKILLRAAFDEHVPFAFLKSSPLQAN